MPVILVVDDEPAWQAMLRRVLEADGYEVRQATDGETTRSMVSAAPPDLILLDDELPDARGVEVCAWVRREAAALQIPVIMLTKNPAVTGVVEALETGADDYLIKPFEFEELRARVRARLRRLHPTEQPPEKAGLSLDGPGRRARFDGHELRLSPREFDLLALFVAEHGRLVSRERIAAEVWAGTCDASNNVIEVYVRRIRRKLADVGYPGRIASRWGRGYLLEASTAPTAPLPATNA